MYGQKEIISCMMIVSLVAILNYYKSIIKRDKEIEQYRRSFLEKQKFDEQLLAVERVAINHALFLRKMLEYNDRCYDVHALMYRPRDYDLEKKIISDINATAIEYKEDNAGGMIVKDDISLLERDKKKFVLIPQKGKENNANAKATEKADTSSIVYVLVAILLGSLVKAALDLTKHYKKKDNNETENDILRRCSLQEYSLLKHKQKKQSKALESVSKKSIPTQRSLDSSSKMRLQQHDQLLRRMSGNPQEYSNGSGFTTEPGTPAKPGKLLAGRPAPLLRRCSVPTIAPNQRNIFRQSRRPSMDSFSEDDLGSETKRRVRMIQRH